METKIERQNHLLPLSPDDRDFKHTQVFGALEKTALPTEDFVVANPLKIKDQRNLDFCPGFSTSEVSEDQEGVELDPLWQFAQIKRVMKEYTSYGADLRSAGKALYKYGSLPQALSPFTIDSGDRDFLANWKNWSSNLDAVAFSHKKQSMFFVDGPHDDFDNIRAVLWKNRLKKQSLIAGTMWRDSWTDAPGGVIPETGWENDAGGGHAIKIFGQKNINGKLYLIIQNSWGEDVGDNGLFYFPRSVINSEFAPYGQIYFSDMTVGDAKYYIDNGITVNDNWFWALIKTFFNLFQKK